MYCSIAIVIDGALAVGASISTFKPASVTAFKVVLPNAAIRVLFCSKLENFEIMTYTRRTKKDQNIIKYILQIRKITTNCLVKYHASIINHYPLRVEV